MLWESYLLLLLPEKLIYELFRFINLLNLHNSSNPNKLRAQPELNQNLIKARGLGLG